MKDGDWHARQDQFTGPKGWNQGRRESKTAKLLVTLVPLQETSTPGRHLACSAAPHFNNGAVGFELRKAGTKVAAFIGPLACEASTVGWRDRKLTQDLAGTPCGPN
jgi:hypothetical protein